MATVRYGERSANVGAVQRALNGYKVTIRNGQWDYPRLVVDNAYGVVTSDAVRNFRAQRGLSYSGNVVDEQMWAMLMGSISGGAGVGFNAGGGTSPRPSVGGGAGISFAGGAGGNNTTSGAGGSNPSPAPPPDPDAPFDWKKMEKYLLYGGALFLLVFLTRD
jgi:peptidoglycan hydrolase-like protein with peptidoglycan-binding domain